MPFSITPKSESAYYVMLGFGDDPPCAFLDVAHRVTERAGGTVDALPHVTVAYLRGAASPEEVSMALAGLSGPRVEFRARGLFAFSNEPHPLFGHAAFLDVEPTADLLLWHLAVRDAVAALPLALARSWADSRPHLRLALHLPRSLREARPLLAGLDDADLTLSPTHLRVSKLEGATFVECLRRPITNRGVALVKTPTVLVILIAALALVAAGAGLFWQTDVQPSQFLTLRGETVTIAGHGLYRYDTVSSAAQQRAQDLVTMLLGIPLLLVSARLAGRGSLRGRLLQTGTLGYFLYTYASMSFLTAFNPLFLVYVALFSLSLFAFVLSFMTIDVAALPSRFSDRLPRRGIAGLFFVIGAFLSLAWLGRIGPALLTGRPPAGLESTTTLVIQVLDLGLVVPLAVLAGILLLRRSAWGYLLASVALLKFLTMSIAVSAMSFNILLVGEAISPLEIVMFPAIAVLTVGFTVALLRNVDDTDRDPATAPRLN